MACSLMEAEIFLNKDNFPACQNIRQQQPQINSAQEIFVAKITTRKT